MTSLSAVGVAFEYIEKRAFPAYNDTADFRAVRAALNVYVESMSRNAGEDFLDALSNIFGDREIEWFKKWLYVQGSDPSDWRIVLAEHRIARFERSYVELSEFGWGWGMYLCPVEAEIAPPASLVAIPFAELPESVQTEDGYADAGFFRDKLRRLWFLFESGDGETQWMGRVAGQLEGRIVLEDLQLAQHDKDTAWVDDPLIPEYKSVTPIFEDGAWWYPDASGKLRHCVWDANFFVKNGVAYCQTLMGARWTEKMPWVFGPPEWWGGKAIRTFDFAAQLAAFQADKLSTLEGYARQAYIEKEFMTKEAIVSNDLKLIEWRLAHELEYKAALWSVEGWVGHGRRGSEQPYTEPGLGLSMLNDLTRLPLPPGYDEDAIHAEDCLKDDEDE